MQKARQKDLPITDELPQARQGDLLLIRTHERPGGHLRKTLEILSSSVTGHTHRITRGQVWDNGNTFPNFYLVIPEGGAQLVHDTHPPINLPAGTYAVRRQMEVNGYVQD